MLVLALSKFVKEVAERPALGHRREQELRLSSRHGARRTQNQLAGRGVGEMNPLEIDDDVARFGGELSEPAQQLLG